jgi:hypothetical protein
MPCHLRWTHCGRWNETASTFHSLYTIGLHHRLPKYLGTLVKPAAASPCGCKLYKPAAVLQGNDHGAADVSGATEAISARYMGQR